ncbi:MAG: universal stress protein [Salinivirgaceae bacterium]|jgi:nucleotide-binding universal stress UspA family protein|nr:universal stress protein [Salinivirgaceae bacterium]
MIIAPEIKKILVPIAIGREGAIALKQAMVFREVYDCEIILLNVIPEGSFIQRIMRPNCLKEQIKKEERKLEKFTMNFFGGEIPKYISLKTTTGSLIPKIIITADRTKCNLIIIKKRKRKITGLSFMKNENADNLISGATCPVLTISGKHTEKGIRNILIPVDVTKRTANKIAWVKYLALKFNAKVHVVSVLDLDIAPYKSLAHRKALEIEKSINEAGLESSVVIIKSQKQLMHNVVLAHIAELKPDLVLIMTHQESILFDNYIGKFASEIIHGSASPVFSLAPRNETLMINLLDSFPQYSDHSLS